MSKPIVVVPGGPSVEFFGEIVRPGSAPLKIDVWRHVRHPPPELMHVATIKAAADSGIWFSAGDPDSLIGKVVTWVWDCRDLSHGQPGHDQWELRLDVRQGGASLEGYPVKYGGPIPRRRPLTILRVAEPVQARSRGA